MSPLRKVLVVAVLTASAAYAVACAAPPASKTLVVACDAKENADEEECKDSDVKGSSKKSERSPTPSETEPPEEDPNSPVATKKDAGADSGSKPSTLGFFCGKLDACCKALARKGITGSANQCASVVTGKNEFACDATYQTYRTPDEYYDPPTECQ